MKIEIQSLEINCQKSNILKAEFRTRLIAEIDHILDYYLGVKEFDKLTILINQFKENTNEE